MAWGLLLLKYEKTHQWNLNVIRWSHHGTLMELNDLPLAMVLQGTSKDTMVLFWKVLITSVKICFYISLQTHRESALCQLCSVARADVKMKRRTLRCHRRLWCGARPH